MSEAAEPSVLRRKAHRFSASAERPAMFPSRALEMALAGAAEAELGLSLSVGEVAESEPRLPEIAAAVGANSLPALLEGPGQATGIAVLSAPLLAAVVAQRMTGRFGDGSAPERPPTRIDAEMARDLIDRTLAGFAAALETGGGADWALGFRYRGFLPDARLVRFSLPDIAYRGFRLSLDIADGAAAGELFLALPSRPPGSGAAAAPAEEQRAWQVSLSASVLGAEMTIDAVLTRLRLPLSRVAELTPGTVLPLPRHVLEDVRLEAPGRALLATGKLGQSRGDRAVRIAEGQAVAGPAPAAPSRPQSPPQPMVRSGG